MAVGVDMFDKMSNYITDMIYSIVPDVDPEKREIIEYGAYMFLSEVIKISVILIISAALNAFIYSLAAILIFGFLRMSTGGIHAKTHWGCMISYSFYILGSVVLSHIVKADRVLLDALIIPYALVITYLYAPADMPVKPIKSKRQRKRLRIQGAVLLAILFIGAQFVRPVWFNLILFTVFIQATLMTPIIYKLTKNRYGKEGAA